MHRCDTCGNTYENPLEVRFEGHTYTFDCFECAIHKLAPPCQNCGCRIVGHGVQSDDTMFCSSHCARSRGIQSFTTHIGHGGHPVHG